MVEQPSKPGYLPALDGLRGVAIALVVVFHVFVGRVSSGVDVFLFLGGVLFVNTQLSNATREGGLTAGQSALRLVRRLFPALLLVVATATVVLILTEPPVGWRTPLEQAAAGVPESNTSPATITTSTSCSRTCAVSDSSTPRSASSVE